MPTNTDLVTDLPADFAVFGQAVDTSMADLLGGTTGQILSKASNTNMDFTWIANDQGDITGVTATSPLTGGGTSGAITVGIQDATTSVKGSVQLSDSTSTTSSVLAATPTAVKSAYDLATTGNLKVSNPVLNSSTQVWQRGTSFSLTATANAYTADRWQVVTTANAATTVSRQATGDTTNLPFIQYCLRLQRNSGQTGTSGQFMYQSIESVNSIPFAGKSVTMSFYVRAGATYTSSGASSIFKLWSGTGTDQNLFSGFTGQTAVASVTPTITSTWQRVTVTGTVAATATQLAIGLDMGAVGTAGATDYLEITGWQIDVGSTVLPFRTYALTIQGEVAACQRYYQRLAASGSNQGLGSGVVNTATRINSVTIRSTVTMRTSPTMSYNGTITGYDGTTSTALSSLTVSQSSTDGAFMDMTFSGATFVVGRAGMVFAAGGSVGNNFEMSAEL
jgi:hypothetical protein